MDYPVFGSLLEFMKDGAKVGIIPDSVTDIFWRRSCTNSIDMIYHCGSLGEYLVAPYTFDIDVVYYRDTLEGIPISSYANTLAKGDSVLNRSYADAKTLATKTVLRTIFDAIRTDTRAITLQDFPEMEKIVEGVYNRQSSFQERHNCPSGPVISVNILNILKGWNTGNFHISREKWTEFLVEEYAPTLQDILPFSVEDFIEILDNGFTKAHPHIIKRIANSAELLDRLEKIYWISAQTIKTLDEMYHSPRDLMIPESKSPLSSEALEHIMESKSGAKFRVSFIGRDNKEHNTRVVYSKLCDKTCPGIQIIDPYGYQIVDYFTKDLVVRGYFVPWDRITKICDKDRVLYQQ